MTERVRDAGFDDFLDALESGDGYYLRCPNDHGLLPPRRVCPECGSQDLTEHGFPESGTVVAQTTIHVGAPSFEGETPYTTAIADFGALRLTGRAAEDVANGDEVAVQVGETEKGERLLVFEAR